MHDDLDAARVSSDAKRNGLISIIALLLLLLIPNKFVEAWALLALAVALCLFLFACLTLLSIRLAGRVRYWFQFVAALGVAAAGEMYFVWAAESDSLVTAIESISPWVILPAVIFALLSWRAGEFLHTQHPFRGFMIAAALIFAFCWAGLHGLEFQNAGYDDDSTIVIDKEAAAETRSSGRYAIQFVVYLIAAYVGLFVAAKQRRIL